MCLHPYQRERVSITGLRFELRKIMKTGRLIGVAVSRLVRLLRLSLSKWIANRSPNEKQRYRVKYCDPKITDHHMVMKRSYS